MFLSKIKDKIKTAFDEMRYGSAVRVINRNARKPIELSDELRCFTVTRETVPALHVLLSILHMQRAHFNIAMYVKEACKRSRASSCPLAKNGLCVEMQAAEEDLDERTQHDHLFDNADGVSKLRDIKNHKRRGTHKVSDEFSQKLQLIENAAYIKLRILCRNINLNLGFDNDEAFDAEKAIDERDQFMNALDVFLTLDGRYDPSREFVVREIIAYPLNFKDTEVFCYESYLDSQGNRICPPFMSDDDSQNIVELLKKAIGGI